MELRGLLPLQGENQLPMRPRTPVFCGSEASWDFSYIDKRKNICRLQMFCQQFVKLLKIID